LLATVHAAEPLTDPGSRYAYASDSFMLLAEVLAARSGRPFADALRHRLLGPLGMVDTGFDPGHWPDRVLPVMEAPGLGRLGRRVVGRFLARATFAGGGLFGTAEDLLRFGRSLLGAPGVPRVLSDTAIETMAGEQTLDLVETIDGLDHPAPGYALGWNRPRADGPSGAVTLAGVPIRGVAPGVLTHAGISGTRLWVDRARGLVVVVLSTHWGVTQVPHAEAIAAIMRG
jgi:CubicO group peptidase (beta-lactamase class C family)